LKKQVEAGADVIQIFDSWANLLTKKDYETYSLIYIKSLIFKLKNDPLTSNIPVILFAREPEFSCNEMIESQADCLSLYWNTKNVDLKFLSGKVALQGNLNPEILLQADSVIKKETNRILDKFKDYQGYIFNLGHGITPNISPDKIKLLTDHIRSR
jgi:uroporphyrinogen decarboxylase